MTQFDRFELRRTQSDVVYEFDRRSRPDGTSGYKRRDADLWIVKDDDFGWIAVNDETNEIGGRSWDVPVHAQGDHPPEGVWVSRKRGKSYVYHLRYLD